MSLSNFFMIQRCTIILLFSIIALPVGRSDGSSWTVGRKTLLYMRVDFSDLPGDPVSSTELQDTLSKVEKFFHDNSYGLLTIESTFTPTLRMPRPASFYESDSDQQDIIRDARRAARQAGYDTKDYTLDIVAFDTRGHGGGAEMAAVGGKGARIIDNFRYGITIHAVGHNLGLPHSNYWKTTDGSVIGPGESIGYGDPYDPMGGGGNADAWRNHFVVRSKALLGWLGVDGLIKVNQTGLYTIYPQDVAQSGPRAIRIIRDSQFYYWVEFRQLITDNPKMMSGVRILRGSRHENAVDLLDMNPGSPNGPYDAPLVLGHTFADPQAGIYITPLRINATHPPSMSVYVYFGDSAVDPKLSLKMSAAPRSVERGNPVDFDAEATGGNVTPLLYSWDFGDGNYDCGHTRVQHYYQTDDRDFVARALVSDMRGHTAAKSVVIQVGQPPTQRLHGYVRTGGQPLADVRVNLAPADSDVGELIRDSSLIGQDSVLTDSDGEFWFVGLFEKSYAVRVFKPGYNALPMELRVPTATAVVFDAVKFDGARTDRSPAKTVLLHVHARIDGTDELAITPTRATWKHLAWDWPMDVTLNGKPMNLRMGMPNMGDSRFLPYGTDVLTAVLVKKSGRGTVDMILRDRALVIRFDDPDPGAADYDADIEFLDSIR
jgi:PKD domain